MFIMRIATPMLKTEE